MTSQETKRFLISALLALAAELDEREEAGATQDELRDITDAFHQVDHWIVAEALPQDEKEIRATVEGWLTCYSPGSL